MNLKDIAAKGVKWNGLSMLVCTLTEILQLVILARLLDKVDFGLMAMIMVVVGFARSFVDMGISNAIIQKPENTKESLSSLYWISILCGLLVFAGVYFSIPLAVLLYQEPLIAGPLFFTSLCFLIIPVGQQFQVLLQKNFKFYQLAWIEMISLISGTVAAVLFALYDYGVYSFVWGLLITTAIRTFLLVIIGLRIWRPVFRFKYSDLEGYLGFGLLQMGERSINYLSTNIDYIIVGSCFGASILGAYKIAYDMVVVPLHRLNPILTKVAFPVFSKKQDDCGALRYGYLELTRILSFIMIPLLLGLAVTAPYLVPAVFGVKWHASIIFVQILALLGIFKSLSNPSGFIMLSKGRPDVSFLLNVFVFAVNAAVLSSAVRWGVQALAFSYVGTSAFFLGVILIILKRLIKLEIRAYLSCLVKPLFFGSIMYSFLFIVSTYISKIGLNPKVSTLILVSLGILLYSSLYFIFDKKFILKLWKEYLWKFNKLS
jgi:teichuronic acid exporter